MVTSIFGTIWWCLTNTFQNIIFKKKIKNKKQKKKKSLLLRINVSHLGLVTRRPTAHQQGHDPSPNQQAL
jgi:hypothetical protein